jgi:metal-responsive CopG/Arc/MetJ family transcriptional regulator
MARPALDKNGSVQITLRIPATWLREIDAIAGRHIVPGLKSKRADVIREAVRRGLNDMKRAS